MLSVVVRIDKQENGVYLTAFHPNEEGDMQVASAIMEMEDPGAEYEIHTVNNFSPALKRAMFAGNN